MDGAANGARLHRPSMEIAAPRRWTRRGLPYADALNALRPGRASDYASLRILRWVLRTADAGRAVVSLRCSNQSLIKGYLKRTLSTFATIQTGVPFFLPGKGLTWKVSGSCWLYLKRSAFRFKTRNDASSRAN